MNIIGNRGDILLKKFLKFIFSKENEYTKKWMARFTIVVFILLLFYPFLSQELLLFHFKNGLSKQMCTMMFTQYTKFVCVLITGYAVTFLGQMGKAYLAKQNEENLKLQRELNGSINTDDENYDDEIDEDEDSDEEE